MAFRTEEQILASFKARYGILHTAMSNKDWFAEIFGVRSAPYSEDVWAEFPPSTNQYNYHDTGSTLDGDIRQTRTWNGSSWVVVGGADNIPVEKLVFPLTRILATNDQSHIALGTPQASISAPAVTPGMRLIDFIKFSDYGTDFMPRLYWDNGSGTAPGAEITTVSLPNDWIFDAPSGLLLCGADTSDEFVPAGNLPIWIQHYRYDGLKGIFGGGDLIKTQDVSCLSSDVVGEFMAIRDDRVGSLWKVTRADPTDITKMPAMGLLISKSASTVGIIQILGPCDIYTGLDYTQPIYYVGNDGQLSDTLPISGGGGYAWVQSVGKAAADDIFWLSGNLTMIKRL